MMGVRGTVILALMVLAAAAVLLLEGPPPGERPESPNLLGEPLVVDPTEVPIALIRFAPEEVERVTLVQRGKRFSTTRAQGTWTGTKLPRVIDDFLDSLTQLAELGRLESDPASLRDYGLNPPQGEIELHLRAGDPLLVQIGDHTPAATGAYVRIGRQGHTAVAGALIIWEFEKALKAVDQ
jgi:hypothetical protein